MWGPRQYDEAMEEVLSAVRRTLMAGEEAKGPMLAPQEPQSSGEHPKVSAAISPTRRPRCSRAKAGLLVDRSAPSGGRQALDEKTIVGFSSRVSTEPVQIKTKAPPTYIVGQIARPAAKPPSSNPWLPGMRLSCLP